MTTVAQEFINLGLRRSSDKSLMLSTELSNSEQAFSDFSVYSCIIGKSKLQIERAAQVFVVSLAWTRPKRNDRQAGHAAQFTLRSC
jgi:hypothetical protein